jgi:intracellular septation protein
MKKLMFDVLSGLLFMVVLLATKNIYAALVVSLATAAFQLVWNKLHAQEVSTMQWVSLALIISTGIASIGTHNARFIMIKPALLELCMGIAMLRREWIKKYLSPSTIKHLPPSMIVSAGYTYAVAMFALAIANATFAFNATQETWAVFNGVAPPLVLALTSAVLYTLCRRLVRTSMRRAGELRTVASGI